MDYVPNITKEQEIQMLRMERPHVVLLGAGASKAALPNGDKNGRQIPLMNEISVELNLAALFPDDLKDLSRTNFESAYSQLFDRGNPNIGTLDGLIGDYFADLRLPDEPNLYDVLNLSLRAKDAIFTFNWDPLIVQSQNRLIRAGVKLLPHIFALHGNVDIGYCVDCEQSGLGMVGQPCGSCGQKYQGSNLLFPVEHKDYINDPFIEREWRAFNQNLDEAFWLTIFGYSAPKTDKEAFDLMQTAWKTPDDRNMEQVEIIGRPGSDDEKLYKPWRTFIHTHHYETHDNFYDSWLANHPRRSGEAYINTILEAQWIEDNPVPQGFATVAELVEWFKPLLDVEHAEPASDRRVYWS